MNRYTVRRGCGPISWEGGVVFLRYYGCGACGNAHWTEDDAKRSHRPGSVIACPHCGDRRPPWRGGRIFASFRPGPEPPAAKDTRRAK